ncbi:Hypothetical predicted protein [Scomber scombrus]|uniref:Uncharacterized protein n=1 Tax=Scomber scombrus TaxID=13677 RepID=A0AAV1N7C2_SCOSC
MARLHRKVVDADSVSCLWPAYRRPLADISMHTGGLSVSRIFNDMQVSIASAYKVHSAVPQTTRQTCRRPERSKNCVLLRLATPDPCQKVPTYTEMYTQHHEDTYWPNLVPSTH